MAKEATPVIAPPAVEAGRGGDARSIMLDVTMSDGTTVKMSRSDYIKQRASAVPQPSRGQIRAEVTKLQGEDVPYQVIFSATKDLYPKKGASAASTEGAAVE